MTEKITSSFHRLTLSTDDVLAGSILSAMQLGVIQNRRVDIAEQKLNLEFTPNDVPAYTQQEAYLKGQLDILQHLIDSSEAASKAAVQQAVAQSQSGSITQ